MSVPSVAPKCKTCRGRTANGGEEAIHAARKALMDELAALDKESREVLGNIVQRLESGTRRTT